MRVALGFLLLGAVAVPAAAHDSWDTYGVHRGCARTYRVERPYWHHPYYARFGYQRPYLYYRQLRWFGYVPYASRCAYGGPWLYTYYPAFVTVAPVYSRFGVALTLADSAFSAPDRDGLPRARTGPVGSRFLRDIP